MSASEDKSSTTTAELDVLQECSRNINRCKFMDELNVTNFLTTEKMRRIFEELSNQRIRYLTLNQLVSHSENRT